jgi:hypothetical protein
MAMKAPMAMLRGCFALAIVASCSHPAAPPRFTNAPPVWVVNDRRNIPKPKVQIAMPDTYAFDAVWNRLVARELELNRQQRARGVNSLDEVPDSTWFTNRSAADRDQIAVGPITAESPEQHLPWTIRSTQVGGTSNGFIITDARGVKYLLKFDQLGYPELETGTDAVVARLLWACGYNVPEDYVVYFRPDQLIVTDESAVKDITGKTKARLSPKDVRHELDLVEHAPDGRVRGIASRWVEGESVGGLIPEGVRADDPNDRVPHQLRRDIRGAYAIYSWLDMVDNVIGNYLDMWVSDPADPKHHYVKHYSIDFGKSLGTMGEMASDPRRGHTYRFDWGDMGIQLFTAGWLPRPYKHVHGPEHIEGVSTLYTVDRLDPSGWKGDIQFAPFMAADRYDQYWGAKIVSRFTRPQIRAAVETGRFTDPRAVEYLTDTIVGRQKKLVAYWYTQVAPLENFQVTNLLCFDDLGIQGGYSKGPTKYTLEVHDFAGKMIARPVSFAPAASGHSCVTVPNVAIPYNGYTIFKLRTQRAPLDGSTYVHAAKDPQTGIYRVIGLYRE